MATHPFALRTLNALDENGNEGCAACGRPRSAHRDPVSEERREEAARRAGDGIVRDVLESLCRRDGLSLESVVVPGEPARNYELADRLGIGHVFGLKEQP